MEIVKLVNDNKKINNSSDDKQCSISDSKISQPLPKPKKSEKNTGHARQRGMADGAQLHRLPARRGPPLLGQSHALHGFGEDAA